MYKLTFLCTCVGTSHSNVFLSLSQQSAVKLSRLKFVALIFFLFLISFSLCRSLFLFGWYVCVLLVLIRALGFHANLGKLLHTHTNTTEDILGATFAFPVTRKKISFQQ